MTEEPEVSILKSLKHHRGLYSYKEEIGPKQWGYYNELPASYEESFGKVLGGKNLKDLVDTTKHPNPVIIDLMAPPRTVSLLISQIGAGRGLSTALPDYLDDSHIITSDGVTWLPGDITKSDTWRGVEKWLDGQKAQLIMERAMGGLDFIPKDKRFLSVLFHNAWKNLDSGDGVLLFELPRNNELVKVGIDIPKWVRAVKDIGYDITYDPGDPQDTRTMHQTGKILLKRNLNSSETLPEI